MNLRLRLADIGDVQKTFEWANDPLARQSSFNTEPITFDTHYAWFCSRLESKDVIYLILLADEVYAGQIRYNVVGNKYICSFLIDADYRGKGFGKTLLKIGEEYLVRRVRKAFTLIGYVKKDNIPSAQSFISNGYKQTETADIKQYPDAFLFSKENIKALKVAILASGALGLYCIEKLEDKIDILCVFTDSNSNGINEWCGKRGIFVFKGNPRLKNVQEVVSQFKIDILFSINYLFLIDKVLIDWPRLHAFNIHGSLLPKYRGRTPHIWAIINSEEKAGFTVHKIDDGCDTGDIVLQQEISITQSMTGGDILQQFHLLYPQAIEEVLISASKGDLQVRKQDDSRATYFGKRTPQEGNIVWEWQKERIYNWVRALTKPYPGAFSYYQNKKIIIYKIAFDDLGYNSNDRNGLILDILQGQPIVKTPNGAIRLLDFEMSDYTELKKGEILHE